MSIRYLYVLCGILSAISISEAQHIPEHQKLNVLFIGNSYMHCNKLPAIIQEMAMTMEDTFYYEMLAYDGYTLERHLEDPKTFEIINSGNWDYVVLQEQSQLPTKDIEAVKKYFYQPAQQLVRWIKESGAEAVFFMTWARRDGDQANCHQQPAVCTFEGMDSLLYTRYNEIATMTESQLAPVGKAWRLARAECPEIELYQVDGSHPNLEGSYLSACVIYSFLSNRDIDNTKYNFLFDESLSQTLKAIASKVY